MKQKGKVRQLNRNAGFSLLELLIAVTILAIITIPMLHMFVTSARINGKSRITLRATVLAQDIVEGLKAYHIEEIQDQFNGVEDFEMLNSSVIAGDCTYSEDVQREKDENGEDPSDPSKAKPGRYYFVLRNAKLENSKFDVLISVDATGYVEGAAPTKHDSFLNTRDVAKIAGMNKSTDAFYEQSALMNEAALSKAQHELQIPGDDVTYKTVGLTCERTFTVTFKDAGTVTDKEGVTKQKTEAFVTCKYEFFYRGETYTYIPDGMAGVDDAGNTGLPCGSFTGKSFYFFYYPLYDAATDKLIFDGTAAGWTKDEPQKLYIAKQTDTSLSDTDLNKAETNYKPVVNILTAGADTFRIFTNLGVNLVNAAFLTGLGVTPSDPKKPESIRELKDLAIFQHNGAVTAKTLDIYYLSGIRDTNYGKEGTDDAITEFIYDIVVEVYEQGAAEAGFPSNMRKVTFDGTKNY